MKSEYILPITIVIAGAVIAAAVFISGKIQHTPQNANQTDTAAIVKNLPPVTAADHILGNPDAPIKIVSYIDLECSHCKQFEATMHQIMNHYGNTGKVAWISRPFPLAQIHKRATKEAEAAECVSDQAGSTGYFNFIDRVFEVSPLEDGLDPAELPKIAGELGINIEKFNQCLSNNTHADTVSRSVEGALKVGAQGTPYSILLYGDDALILSGAQPYDSVRAAIDTILPPVNPVTPTSSSSSAM